MMSMSFSPDMSPAAVTSREIEEQRKEGTAHRARYNTAAVEAQNRASPEMQLADYNAGFAGQQAWHNEQARLGMNEYADAIRGSGPSLAALQQRAQVGKGAAEQYAGGVGNGSALGAVASARQGAGAMGSAVFSGAQDRSEEQRAAELEYANLLQQQRSQDYGAASAGQSMAQLQANIANKQRALNDAMTRAYQNGDFATAEALYKQGIALRGQQMAYEQAMAEAEAANKKSGPWDYVAAGGGVLAAGAATYLTGGAAAPMLVPALDNAKNTVDNG